MSYVTGETIKKLREQSHMTQRELADRIGVSDKAVSKWETNKGLPDAGIIEDLAAAFNVSLTELFTGDLRTNENRSANIRRLGFYVCPVCGNVIVAMGEGSYSCCGVHLHKEEVETENMVDTGNEAAISAHAIHLEECDGEIVLSMQHPMEKNHSISFVAMVTFDRVELVKLYPEQEITVRFPRKKHANFYAYCNRHGLYKVRV